MVGHFSVRHENEGILPIQIREVSAKFFEIHHSIKSVKLYYPDGSFLGEMEHKFGREYVFTIPQTTKIQVYYGTYFGVTVHVELAEKNMEIPSDIPKIQLEKISITGDRPWTSNNQAETVYSKEEFPVFTVQE